ncbi:thrombospondin type 1 domain protein [Ancylostoma duodenale]|uniref:Thrombospondin type 1 domain protein n=1 Tax=Ancylostoma duodenale TaxID=51022 RepID=A0A0C2E122_9BILA|nr:thrombospondin type 1 domain protein [Ancylostoma duodenale]
MMESRRRFCLVADPAVQGFCTGSIVEQRPCAPTSCTASPGGWSAWSDWSQCSKDCQGTGHQIRNRMCSDPLPSNRSTQSEVTSASLYEIEDCAPDAPWSPVADGSSPTVVV